MADGAVTQGQKHVLALREGTTENATVCKSLLADLHDRGLDLERAVLLVIDGGTGLRKALRDTCGPTPVVHRCQVHKRRWCDGRMLVRWITAGLQEVRGGFRRLRGHRDLAALIRALDRTVMDSRKEVA